MGGAVAFTPGAQGEVSAATNRCPETRKTFALAKAFSVGVPGLEPGTSSLSVKRSNRLSYTPVGFGLAPSTSETLPDP